MASLNSESPIPPNHPPNSSDTSQHPLPLLEGMNPSRVAFLCTPGLYRVMINHDFTGKEFDSVWVDYETRRTVFRTCFRFIRFIYPLKLIEVLRNRGLSQEEIKTLILDAGIDGRNIVVAGSLPSEEGRDPSVIIDNLFSLYSNDGSITSDTLNGGSVNSSPDEEDPCFGPGVGSCLLGGYPSFRVVVVPENRLLRAGIGSFQYPGFFQRLHIAGGEILKRYGIGLPPGSPSSVRSPLADIESQLVPDGRNPSSRFTEIIERLRSPLEAIGKLEPTKLIHLFRAFDEDFKSGNKFPDQAMMALIGLAAIYFVPETKHLQGLPLDFLTVDLALAFTGSFAGNQLQGCYPRVAKALDKVATLCMATAFFTVTSILLPKRLIFLVGLFALISLGSFIRGLF